MSTTKNYPNENLVPFFTEQLARIYYGKQHLLNQLPTLKQKAFNKNLGHAVGEMHDNVLRQMERIEKIHRLLQQPLPEELSSGIEGLLKEFNHTATHTPSRLHCDLALVYYLQNIESIELSGFKMMRMTAVIIRNEEVKQLLRENYDEAKESRQLLLLLTAELLTKG